MTFAKTAVGITGFVCRCVCVCVCVKMKDMIGLAVTCRVSVTLICHDAVSKSDGRKHDVLRSLQAACTLVCS